MEIGRLVGDEGVPVAGVAGEVVAEGLGGAEDPEQPVAQGLGGDQGVQEGPPLGAVETLGEPDEAEQGQVGVGGGAEGVEEEGSDRTGASSGVSSSRSAAAVSVKP
ncbi:hypothetical protein ACFQ2B_23190 [Streptomyces stramineus]